VTLPLPLLREHGRMLMMRATTSLSLTPSMRGLSRDPDVFAQRYLIADARDKKWTIFGPFLSWRFSSKGEAMV